MGIGGDQCLRSCAGFVIISPTMVWITPMFPSISPVSYVSSWLDVAGGHLKDWNKVGIVFGL